jgi:DnaJ-class molecular chaperone
MTKKQCPYCNGQGYFAESIAHYVTRDMAMDAGDMSLEGMKIEHWEQVQCERCWGSGFVEEDTDE